MTAVLVAGVIGVCYLQLKKRRERAGMLINHVCVLRVNFLSAEFMQRKVHPRVTNPIYEAGDDVYEELPDPIPDKQKTITDAVYTDVAPPLPSTRYDHLAPAGKLQNEDKRESIGTPPLVITPKHGDKVIQSLTIPSAGSASALSALSGADDCYTVMNPAGTLTIVPRSRHSGLAGQWGSSPAGEG